LSRSKIERTLFFICRDFPANSSPFLLKLL